jgi:hypothetical protein
MKRQFNTQPDSAERLQEIIVNGVYGDLSYDELERELDLFSEGAEGRKYELKLSNNPERIVFCAGSWSVKAAFCSRDARSLVTVLAETPKGPGYYEIAPYEDTRFLILDSGQ